MAASQMLDRSKLVLNADAERLFSKRDWQRGFRASMIVAGRNWIATALPLRFTGFAESHLGYHAKKMSRTLGREAQIRRAIAAMRVNGERAALIAKYCAPWGGWDPTGREGPPDQVWRQWYQNALRLGRVKRATDADGWRVARAEMRRDVMRQSNIQERIRNWAIDEYVDQEKTLIPEPLVKSGWLRKTAQANARPDAKARGGNTSLRIVIPRADRVAPIVGKVLSQSTAEEQEEVSVIVSAEMTAFIQGAKVTTTTRRVKRTVLGKSYKTNVTTTGLRSTARQQRQIGARIRGSQTKSARASAHKNRQSTAHTPRG